MTQIPLFQPPSEWIPPETIPDLSEAKEICIDLETNDVGLNSNIGPGWPVKKGFVAGVAIAVDGWTGYFPLRHEGGGNFDEKIFIGQLKKILELPCDKVFHNAMYDVGWLHAMGLKVHGRIIDTMIAAPLVDENRFRYALNDLGRHYLGETKSEALLYEAAKSWGVDAKGEMWKLPCMYVGPYAEQDTVLTLKLWHFFKTELLKQDLLSIFDLETKLFPILFEMKKKGVRIDLDEAERTKNDFAKREKKILDTIRKDTGVAVDIWTPTSVAKAFDAENITYDRTPKSGQPKFDKNFLNSHPSQLAKNIVEAREINKARTTFIDTILKHTHRGRIHAEIHQMRSDQGGTVTGRFSYSNPNLQQIPARNNVIGPRIRRLFISEEGCKWGTFDYSQQEPRITVHFARLTNGGLPGSHTVIEAYENEDADFHQVVADMAGIDRKTAKTINLGMMYGMGKGKLGSELGLDEEDTADLWKQYHKRVPFVKELADKVSSRAQEVGYIRTLLGRKCRFDLWEPNLFGINKPLPRDEAEREHGKNIRRAFTYKALNKLIQGSAADQTKQAMIDLHEEGFLPHIQVHDELNLSVENPEQYSVIKKIMENCVELKVKCKVDVEVGNSWGEIKEVND